MCEVHCRIVRSYVPKFIPNMWSVHYRIGRHYAPKGGVRVYGGGPDRVFLRGPGPSTQSSVCGDASRPIFLVKHKNSGWSGVSQNPYK